MHEVLDQISAGIADLSPQLRLAAKRVLDHPNEVAVSSMRAFAARAGDAGVGEVSVSPLCAAHDATRFFSHRRSGGTDGRMLAYLGRPIA